MRLKLGGKYTGGGWMQKKRLACSKLRPLRPLFVRFNNRLALVLADAINSKFVDSKAQILFSSLGHITIKCLPFSVRKICPIAFLVILREYLP